MQLSSVMIHQLNDQLQTRYAHRNVTERPNLRRWEVAGRPHCWINLTNKSNYHLYRDYGYGWIALFYGEHLLGVDKEIIITNEVIAINDADIEHYLYFPD